MVGAWTKDNWPTEEEAQAMIAGDPENPELTADGLDNMRPAAEVLPKLAEAVRRQIGRPRAGAPKVAVSIRLDRDVAERFKATGKGWQTRINAIPKEAKL